MVEEESDNGVGVFFFDVWSGAEKRRFGPSRSFPGVEGAGRAGCGKAAYFLLLADFLGRRTAWMLGRTPPWAMVTPARSLLSSSSFLTAS